VVVFLSVGNQPDGGGVIAEFGGQWQWKIVSIHIARLLHKEMRWMGQDQTNI